MSRFPHPSPAFAGPSFRGVLERKQAAALRAVNRLQAVDDSTSDRILASHDVAICVVDWETPSIDVEATEDNHTRYTIAWPVSPPADALKWEPNARWLTAPDVIVGVSGRHVVAIVEGPGVSEADILAGTRRARRFIDAHLTALWEQRQEWRSTLVRQVRAAVRIRRELLTAVTDLKAGVE
jgi:hypothetical protein